MPLLQPVWQRHGADTVRLLALFTVAVLGMDVGILLLVRAFEVTPYAWVLRPEAGGGMAEVPYLYLNSRWANQLTVLLIWTFVPLLQQRNEGGNRAAAAFLVGDLRRGAAAGPQLDLAEPGGWRPAGRGGGGRRPSPGRFALNRCPQRGRLLHGVRPAGGGQLAPAAPTAQKRIVLWPAYDRVVLASPWLGVAIPAIAPASPECTPHNLWLALLHWSGRGVSVMALPLLLVLLPGLKLQEAAQPSAQLLAQQKAPQRWLQRFGFPAATYRLLAVVGLLLITVSSVVPGGVGFAPSALVTMPKAACLLLF